MNVANNVTTMGGGGLNGHILSPTNLREQQFDERWRLFQDFLRSQLNNGSSSSSGSTASSKSMTQSNTYEDKLRDIIKQQQRRILINVNDVRSFNLEAAKGLLQMPLEWLPPLERAVSEVCIPLYAEYSTASSDSNYNNNKQQPRLQIGFEGAFGDLHTSPRFLTSRFISHMVCLDGIVTSCSLVRPKLLRSVHYNEFTNSFVAKEYSDATQVAPTNLRALGNNSYPTEDEHQHKLLSEFGLSTFRDCQTISVQEMPEKAPPGQLPRSIDILLTDDLVDAVKPGDRVQITGVYKALASIFNGVAPGTFRALLIANNVKLLHGHLGAPTSLLTPKDVATIKALGKRKDIFQLLSRSLAPSIYGHDLVKQAVLLMLLGGVERNFASSGAHLRGDINLLLVGDPSTAKRMAPLAIATTGRGSSGVGLTAAVVSDKETGERRLEAGAMVLADRGIVCIDEFDKMGDMDRVAIHEVMEQQTVTIAKAGIHTTLNARCSVLAAANPIRGQYVPTESPQYNIGLPDSLLSRFDLLFIVLDQCDSDTDRRIATHVLKLHRFVGDVYEEEEHEGNMATEDEQIFYNDSNVNNTEYDDDDEGDEGAQTENEERLTVDFVKKYLRYAKTLQPTLTMVAADLIAQAYTEFRQRRELQQAQQDLLVSNTRGNAVYEPISERHKANALPVTARTLETMIRLSTAHAKARLSDKVDKRDAKLAISLVNHCLWHEIISKPPKKSTKRHRAAAKDDEDDGDDDATVDDEDHDHDISYHNDEAVSPKLDQLSLSQSQHLDSIPIASSQIVPLATPESEAMVRQALNQIRNRTNGSMVPLEELQSALPNLSIDVINAVLEAMQHDNLLMLCDNLIILI